MTDQSKQGLFSSFLQRRRVNAVKKYITGDVLDFGCGNGKLVNYITVHSYIGYDPNEEVINIAKEEHQNWEYSTKLPTDRKFDTIVMLAVIEHIHQPSEILTILGSMITDNGHIIITTPHPTYETLYKIGAWLGLFSRSASDEHDQLINPSLLSEISNKAGLRIESHSRFLIGANQLFILSKK